MTWPRGVPARKPERLEPTQSHDHQTRNSLVWGLPLVASPEVSMGRCGVYLPAGYQGAPRSRRLFPSAFNFYNIGRFQPVGATCFSPFGEVTCLQVAWPSGGHGSSVPNRRHLHPSHCHGRLRGGSVGRKRSGLAMS